ncbi:tRNA1(Val) (adenine(37)-N6)-methyltransferase [Jannaschia marina]|uniref:tRNA1(Val) (adenine(37)-N6)-methyltransferase n=1 Tax=Jannaschia marina TaxID=2741674 RepID=UPI0015CD70FB|nr:methyltransferase [Jannaschia marina]
MTGETTRDAFLGGRLTLLQPARGFRAGSDAVLLAAACPARAGERVLDLGCGVGAAMYCLGHRVPGVSLTGVECDPETAALARRNGGAEVVEGDALDPPSAVRRSFDHVICNPPYFAAGSGRPTADIAREAALRDAGDFPRWLDAAVRRAGPKGSVTLIARADRFEEMIVGLSPRLGALVVLPIAARAGRAAQRVLVQGRKGRRAAMRLLAPLVLHEGPAHLDDGNDHSAAAERVLRHGGALLLE